MKYCAKCGAPNDDDGVFCRQCGSPHPLSGPAQQYQQATHTQPPPSGSYTTYQSTETPPAVQTSQLQEQNPAFNTQYASQPESPSSNRPQPPRQSSGETVLFSHVGASLVTIDNRRVSIPPHSGTIVISDSRFMFLSRGKRGAVAMLGGGSLTYGLISRGMSNVNVDEINEYLTRPGSFQLPTRGIREISASPSTVLHPGKITLSSLVQVRPNDTNVQGSSVTFAFMARGSPGGTILKEEECNHLRSLFTPSPPYQVPPPQAPPPMATPAAPPVPNCTTCGRPATYIAQYGRYYCYNCSQYV